MMRRWIVAAAVLVGSGASLALRGADESVASGGQEGVGAEWPQLRIESQLLVNGQKQLAPRSLFDGGKVYDYLDAGEEIDEEDELDDGEVTVFEPADRRFTLLHPSKNVACEVSFEQIEQHQKDWRSRTSQAVKELEGQTDAALRERARLGRWLLAPDFEEEYRAGSLLLTLASPYLVYQVQGEPMDRLHGGTSAARQATDHLAAALRSYWDWYARLNHLLNPRALPPQARMAVNARLAEHRIVPAEVELSVLFGGRAKIRTTHKTRAGLRPEDRRRVEETRRSLSRARRVSLQEYLRETSR